MPATQRWLRRCARSAETCKKEPRHLAGANSPMGRTHARETSGHDLENRMGNLIGLFIGVAMLFGAVVASLIFDLLHAIFG